MEIPDYFLDRPEGPTAADLVAFERLHTDQVEPGGGHRIDYRLTGPRWQFLCWLTETKEALLRAGNADVHEFEPRRPADTSEFGSRNAVLAASDGIWATLFAVVDRAVATSLVNMSVVVGHEGAERSLYYFSVNDDALVRGASQSGIVYLLPAGTFSDNRTRTAKACRSGSTSGRAQSRYGLSRHSR